MILGALIDLGVDEIELRAEISKLGLEGIRLEISKVNRSGIDATHVEVRFPEQHHYRHLSDIIAIIERAKIYELVKDRAKAIFTRLAEAEAKVHGIPVEEVHFHEVGAVDAIVDIVGACVCLKILGIEKFACSALHTGSGFIEMDHGKYPVPPPAVAELVNGFEIYSEGIEGELLTPTGAAIIAEFCEESGPMPSMKVESTGYGAGTREYEKFPNVLRLLIGEAKTKTETANTEHLRLFETNIDDSTPQTLGFVMDRAFELGALDCWFTPIHMKKNRPAVMLSVLAGAEAEAEIKKLLFTETSTIGLRIRDVSRECLERTTRIVETEFGDVEVKIAYFEGEIVNMKPEFDQMRSLAERDDVTLREVEKAVASELGNENFFKAKG
jgi:uncharacterized protein (TIGR00299 family) protein